MTGRVEVVGRVSGRQSRSDEEKLDVLAEAFGPGVRVRDVPQRRGLSSGLVCTWRERARRGLLGGMAPAFAKVRVAEVEPVAPAPRLTFDAGLIRIDLHERATTPLTTDILDRIGTLYAIEAEVRGQSPDARHIARQDRIAGRCLTQGARCCLRRLLPKSEIAKAIAYGTKRSPAFYRFLDDGRLEIDNNIAERALRGIAVGRRN